MAEPTPANVSPWYLRNINQALALDETSGNVYVRTGFEGNIIISGNVNIPGNVDAHISEIGTSGNLTVPYMPIAGNITIDPGQTIEVTQGTDPWTVDGTVTVNQGTNPWVISGNVNIDNQATDVTIADSNYEMNIARGLVDSQYNEMKNGYAPSMSTGLATVWGLNTTYPWSAWGVGGSRLFVASSNAGDVGQTITIEGLDTSFAKISETVTLNGTTAVQTTATFFRINRMYTVTGNAPAGNVSARVTSSSGTQVGYILAGFGRAKGGFFTVPAGYTAYILYGDCSSYKNGSGNVSGQVDMFTRTNAGGTRPFLNQFTAVVANGQYRNEFIVPLAIPEKTDIDVQFNPEGNATTVSVNWEMILIPN